MKGGVARANALDPQRRREIARKAGSRTMGEEIDEGARSRSDTTFTIGRALSPSKIFVAHSAHIACHSVSLGRVNESAADLTQSW